MDNIICKISNLKQLRIITKAYYANCTSCNITNCYTKAKYKLSDIEDYICNRYVCMTVGRKLVIDDRPYEGKQKFYMEINAIDAHRLEAYIDIDANSIGKLNLVEVDWHSIHNEMVAEKKIESLHI